MDHERHDPQDHRLWWNCMLHHPLYCSMSKSSMEDFTTWKKTAVCSSWPSSAMIAAEMEHEHYNRQRHRQWCSFMVTSPSVMFSGYWIPSQCWCPTVGQTRINHISCSLNKTPKCCLENMVVALQFEIWPFSTRNLSGPGTIGKNRAWTLPISYLVQHDDSKSKNWQGLITLFKA